MSRSLFSFLLGDLCLYPDDRVFVSGLSADALLCISHQGLIHPCLRIGINITATGTLTLRYLKNAVVAFPCTQWLGSSYFIFVDLCVEEYENAIF